MNRYFIGVDPGASGGIAVIYPSGHLKAIAMPKTEQDVWRWFSELSPPSLMMVEMGEDGETLDVQPVIVHAVIEKVGGYIGGGEGEKGGGAANGSSMFKFGTSYGGLRMALIAAEIPFEEKTPQTWQKTFSLSKAKGESKTSFKNRLKAKAQQLFPSGSITLATADAILIAEYCRRVYGGAPLNP